MDVTALGAAVPVAPQTGVAWSDEGLELVGLRKQYGTLVALSDCSLRLPPGRVLGLLGPNGAGKTTAMRCIFGLVEPDAGDVRWNGRPIDPGVRLRFGYMPEERGLYPQMRVGAQLEYLAQLSGLDRPEATLAVERWLARLELGGRASARLATLSHGNQQRVQLAAALAHDPVAVVLDEPFAGLDPIGVDALSAMIRELARDGTSVLFSSHQLDLVEDVCDDVVVLDRGRVVLAGELARLRAASDCRYLEVGYDDGSATRIKLRGSVDLESLAAAAAEKGRVARFSLEPPSLSDLFHEAVER
jgi:ABC-2 type transport system ATP-binding protein